MLNNNLSPSINIRANAVSELHQPACKLTLEFQNELINDKQYDFHNTATTLKFALDKQVVEACEGQIMSTSNSALEELTESELFQSRVSFNKMNSTLRQIKVDDQKNNFNDSNRWCQ